MGFNRSIRYDTADDFFTHDGDSIMKLNTDAAINVCKLAFSEKCVISAIEGGIWQNPGFQSNLNSIWNSELSGSNYQEINERAIKFIKEVKQSENVDTFIITIDHIADL